MFSPSAYQLNGQEYIVFGASGHDGFIQTFPVNSYEDKTLNNIGDMWYGGPSPAHNPALTGDLFPHRVSRGPTPLQVNDSAGLDDDYPSVSYDDPPRLIFTSSPDSTGASAVTGEDTEDQELFVLENITNGYPGYPDGVFYGPVKKIALPDVRRAIFLPPE